MKVYVVEKRCGSYEDTLWEVIGALSSLQKAILFIDLHRADDDKLYKDSGFNWTVTTEREKWNDTQERMTVYAIQGEIHSDYIEYMVSETELL